jgi:hypothetical protein
LRWYIRFTIENFWIVATTIVIIDVVTILSAALMLAFYYMVHVTRWFLAR